MQRNDLYIVVPIMLILIVVNGVIGGVSLGVALNSDLPPCLIPPVLDVDLWLIVYAAVTIATVFVAGSLAAIMMRLERPIGFRAISLIALPFWLFHLAWGILGFVCWNKWKDCTEDVEPVLWRTGQAMVILEWIVLFAILLVIACFAAVRRGVSRPR